MATALRRSDGNEGDRLFNDKEFRIEPEYLDSEEIKTELRMRNLDACGGRRAITDRLRQALSKEKLQGQQPQFIRIGLASKEMEYVAKRIPYLLESIATITLDPTSHDRFMSMFLHVDGRLQRIPQKEGNLNLSTHIFEAHEKLGEIYHRFLSKVRDLTEANRKQYKLVPPINVSLPESHVLTQTDNGTAEKTHNTAASASQEVQAVPSAAQQQRRSLWEGVDLATNTDSGLNRQSLEALARVLRQKGFNGLNATQRTNDQARLSRDFLPNNAEDVTPIQRPTGTTQSNINSSFPLRVDGEGISRSRLSEPINLTQSSRPISNFNEHHNTRDTGFTGFGQPNSSFSGTNLNGRDSEHFQQQFEERMSMPTRVSPPPNFGDFQRSSMPSYAVENREQPQNGWFTQQQRNDLPPYAEYQPFATNHNSVWPESSVFGRTYNNNEQQFSRSNQRSATNNLPRNDLNDTNELSNTLNAILQAVTSLTDRMDGVENQQRNTPYNHRVQGITRPRVSNEIFTVNQAYGPSSDRRRINIETPYPRHESSDNDDHSEDRPRNFRRENRSGRRFGNETGFDNRRDRPVPINKWNFKFTANANSKIPEERDLTAFLKRIELQSISEKMPYAEIFEKIHYLLGECAMDWYIQYRDQFCNWEELVRGMKRQFTTPLTSFLTMARLSQCRQGKDETSMQFIAKMSRDFDAVNLNNELERIAVIQNGLRSDLRRISQGNTWRSVQQMDLHLRTFEQSELLHKESNPKREFNRFTPRKQVNAVKYVYESDIEERTENEQSECESQSEETPCNVFAPRKVDKRNKTKAKSSSNAAEEANKKGDSAKNDKSSNTIRDWRPGCYNCGSESHRFANCDKKEKKLFCYSCGKEGVISTQCECSKNRKSVALVGVENDEQNQ